MARPIKQGLDYFPLDVDIDADDKIAIIEALHGIEGFGIIIKLLMKIYKEGYFYEWNKREQILFAKRVNVDINQVNVVVNEAINEGLFNKNLFDQHKILTSKGIQKRYLEAIKRRKEVTFIKDFYLIEDPQNIIGTSNMAIYVVDANNNKVNVNINSVNDNISTQRKGKERKEKERKTTTTENDTAKIIQFWDDNGFGFNNIYAKNQLLDWLDEPKFKEPGPIILQALEIAAAANKRTLKYVEGIIKNWFNSGCTTLTDVVAKQEEFEQQNGGSKLKAEAFDLND